MRFVIRRLIKGEQLGLFTQVRQHTRVSKKGKATAVKQHRRKKRPRHKLDTYPDQAGPIRWDMTMAEVEDAIVKEDHEHIAIFASDGRQLFRGDPAYTLTVAEWVDTRVMVAVDIKLAGKRATRGATYTHNHPSGNWWPSEADMDVARRLGVRAFRVVTPTVTCIVRRKGKQWVVDDSWSLRTLRQLAQSGAMERMDAVIRRAGGRPEDGEHAIGFSTEVYRGIYGEEFERFYREGGKNLGYTITIERHPDRRSRGRGRTEVSAAITAEETGGAATELKKATRLGLRAQMPLSAMTLQTAKDVLWEALRKARQLSLFGGDKGKKAENEEGHTAAARPALPHAIDEALRSRKGHVVELKGEQYKRGKWRTVYHLRRFYFRTPKGHEPIMPVEALVRQVQVWTKKRSGPFVHEGWARHRWPEWQDENGEWRRGTPSVRLAGGREIEGRRVDGTYVAEIPCNAKCTSARGPRCECSCGGANHGAGSSVRWVERSEKQIAALLQEFEKGEQLKLFGQPGGGETTVKPHTRRTKMGVSAVKQHQRKTPPRQAEKPKEKLELTPQPPAPPETSGRKVHHPVGEVVPGSRRETFKKVTVSNLAELEKKGEMEAHKAVTKKAVWGEYDVDADKALGSTSGASFAKHQLWKSIRSSPAGTSMEARLAYVHGIDWLRHELDTCHTVDAVKGFLENWKEMTQGRRAEGAPMTGGAILEMLGLPPEGEGWARGGYSSLGDGPDGESRLVHHSTLRQKGYAGLRWLSQGKDGERRFQMLKPIEKDERNTYSQYADAMGEKMAKIVSRRGRTTPVFWRKDMSVARDTPNDDWSWTGAKAKTGGGRGKQWRREMSGKERAGGPEVTGPFTGERLADDFGFRAVDYGNYVTDKEAGSHVRRAVEALTDLADIVGIDKRMIANGQMLALAFGARGKGWAKAHYEPGKVIINLTKTKGNGSLAHEWGHFMDHVLTGAVGKWIEEDGRLRGHMLSHGDGRDVVHPDVMKAMDEVMGLIRGDDISDRATELRKKRRKLGEMNRPGRRPTPEARAEFQRLLKTYNAEVQAYNTEARARGFKNEPSKYSKDAHALGSYWKRPREMFARAWESFIEDELRDRGRLSPYLVEGTQRRYNISRAKVKRSDIEPYPHGEERKQINLAMRKLCDAIARNQELKKAMERILIRRWLVKAEQLKLFGKKVPVKAHKRVSKTGKVTRVRAHQAERKAKKWTKKDRRSVWGAYEGWQLTHRADPNKAESAPSAPEGKEHLAAAHYLRGLANVYEARAIDKQKAADHFRDNPKVYGDSTPEMIERFTRLAQEDRKATEKTRALADRIEREGMPERLEKGVPIKDRPGLRLDPTKHRWVRVTPEEKKERQPTAEKEQPKPRGPGTVEVSGPVAFMDANGQTQSGTIRAAGARGVTVVDKGGKVHKVEHGDYQKTAPGEPEAKPEQPAEEKRTGKTTAAPEALDIAKNIFNRDVTGEELAHLGGVPLDSDVEITPTTNTSITIEVKSDEINMERLIGGGPPPIVENIRFLINDEKMKGQGIGTSALLRQARQAEKLGVEKILTFATGSKDSKYGMVGYYVWPRLGYDGDLSAGHKAATGKERVSELMATPEGRAYWKANGSNIDVEFDPASGSLSRRVLESYVQEKMQRLAKAVESGGDKAAEHEAGKRNRGDTPPELSDEDEATLDRIWDEIAKKANRPMAKGVPIKDRPGLRLDPIKHRWVRVTPEEKKGRRPARAKPEEEKPAKKSAVEVGGTATFTDESGKAQTGKVQSAGDRGATIVGADGGAHKVEHGKFQAPGKKAPAEPKAETKPEPKERPEAKQEAPAKEKPEPEAKPTGAPSDEQEAEATDSPEHAETEGQTGDNGDGTFNVNGKKIHDEPMPELPEGFNDLKKMTRARLTARFDDVQKELDARFPSRDYGATDHASALDAAKSHWGDIVKEGWVGKSNAPLGEEMISTFGEQLEAAGASHEDASELLQSMVRRLAHQEIEATRRTLGDHGVRHLSRNVRTIGTVLDALEKGGIPVGPKQRLASSLAMLNHDLGYTIPAIARGGFDVRDNYHPQASFVMWNQENKQNDIYNRVLGSDLVKRVGAMIVNHSGSNINWTKDPMGSAMRLADNTHLFADKMPEVLFNNKQAMELLTKVNLAVQSGQPEQIAPVRQALIDHINGRDDLDPPQKTALLQAAKEVGKKTAKFLVSRLAGRDLHMEYDSGSKTMHVDVEQSPLRQTIGEVFGDDHKDAQFVKMLKDYGVEEPGDILKGKPPPDAKLTNKHSGSSIHFKWAPPRTEATPIERTYAETAKRVMGEWKNIGGMGEQEKEAALSDFWKRLEKAHKEGKPLKMAIRSRVRRGNGKDNRTQPRDASPSIAEAMMGARVRFRHPGNGQEMYGTGHAAGHRGMTILDEDGIAHKVEHGNYMQHRDIDSVPRPRQDDEGAKPSATENTADQVKEYQESFANLRGASAASGEFDEHSNEHMKMGPRSRVGALAAASKLYQAADIEPDWDMNRGQVDVKGKTVHVRTPSGSHELEDAQAAAMVNHYKNGQGEDKDRLFPVSGADVDQYVGQHVPGGLGGMRRLRKNMAYAKRAGGGEDLDDLAAELGPDDIDETVSGYLHGGGEHDEDFDKFLGRVDEADVHKLRRNAETTPESRTR